MFKSLQKDNVCKRQKPRVKRYKATHWVVSHCGSTIIRGVARKIPEVNKKSQIFHHPGCIAIYLPLPLLNVTEIQFWKKIRTKTCKRQKFYQNSVPLYHSQINTSTCIIVQCAWNDKKLPNSWMETIPDTFSSEWVCKSPFICPFMTAEPDLKAEITR